MAELFELKEILALQKDEIEKLNIFYEQEKFESKLKELEAFAESHENFWNHPKYVETTRQIQKNRDVVDKFSAIKNDYAQLIELCDLVGEDPVELQDLEKEILDFSKRVKTCNLELLLSEEFDQNNCYLSINPGAGGTESQDWADMLLRMYLRFCDRKKFKVDILDLNKANEAGIKSATILIEGKNVYGTLKGETGIHRLVRISPFDANKRRHTSFSAVQVTPEIEDIKFELKEADIKIDTYRAGGAGGQHVNTTDSAVRITHLPTGIVVQCQNERSQHQNKAKALKMLYSRIIETEERKKMEAANSQEKQKIEWGSQIRSYVLHPYKMVKDHRTDEESGQPELVLDGELDDFIASFLIKRPDKNG